MKFLEFKGRNSKGRASICVEAIIAFEECGEKTQVYFGSGETLVIPVSYDEFKTKLKGRLVNEIQNKNN